MKKKRKIVMFFNIDYTLHYCITQIFTIVITSDITLIFTIRYTYIET